MFVFRTVSHYENYLIPLILVMFRTVSHYENYLIPLIRFLFRTVSIENDLYMVKCCLYFASLQRVPRMYVW